MRAEDSARSTSAAQGFGETDQFVGGLLDASQNFLVDDLIALERVARRINESRNDHRSKIEHQTIGVSHYRHVTAVSAGGAKKSHHFFFPRTPGQLDHV